MSHLSEDGNTFKQAEKDADPSQGESDDQLPAQTT
jgi:hypothetical protein